ncbi:MAG: NUDIX hydrolase [Corynebacterium sp.]|nr:NUDIX hydrolase [Corynebacterium sp.]
MTTVPGQHTFTVTQSEVLLDAPIIAVRRDRVVMPGGNEANREIVEHFGAVAVVASDGHHIAMVRQYRHCVGERLWELPAGILDVADEDPLVCAQRELQEEAGQKAATWHLLTDLVCSPGFCEEAVRIYLARDLERVARAESDDEEADLEVVWVSIEEAHQMVLRGQIVNSIAIAGIMVALDVFAGRAVPRSVEEPFVWRPQSLARRRKAAGLHEDMKRL